MLSQGLKDDEVRKYAACGQELIDEVRAEADRMGV
jgi:hypothetical protein